MESSNKISLADFNGLDAATGITLALETGIGGGSLALLRDGSAIDVRTGNQAVSRAEDVLNEIDTILQRNDISRKAIALVAVSSGPGSFTGLRIGAAIAKGLRRSLDCEISAEPLLPSLIRETTLQRTIVAVPFGKNQLCWQYFGDSEHDFVGDGQHQPAADFLNQINVSQSDSFFRDLNNLLFMENRKTVETAQTKKIERLEKIVLTDDLYRSLMVEESAGFSAQQFQDIEFVNVGSNLARYVGARASARLSKNPRVDFVKDFDLIYPRIK